VSGGGERVAKSVSEGLAASGHDVTVHTSSYDKTKKESNINNVRVCRCRSVASVGNTRFAPNQFIPNFSDTDIVHAHNTTPPGVISGYLHSRFTGSPLIITHHGNDRYVPEGSIIKKSSDYMYSELLLERILEYASIITLPSKTYASESQLIRKFSEKLEIIPNGVRTRMYNRPDLIETACEFLNISPNQDIVSFVGDIIPKKGPDLLVEAATSIDSEAIVVAGDGQMLDDLRENKPECVSLPGYVPEEVKIGLLNASKLLCLPSRIHTEVFPLVILEAYASGTPVVTSDLGTFSDIVSEKCGRRVPRDNATALATTVNNLLLDSERLEMMSKAAREESIKYEWKNLIERYESIFLENLHS
jgi:glycosyltransferase involved in cell wall biosynthesis